MERCGGSRRYDGILNIKWKNIVMKIVIIFEYGTYEINIYAFQSYPDNFTYPKLNKYSSFQYNFL